MSLIPLISNIGIANNYKSYSQTQSPFSRRNNGFVRTNHLVISQNKMRRKKIELEFNSIVSDNRINDQVDNGNGNGNSLNSHYCTNNLPVVVEKNPFESNIEEDSFRERENKKLNTHHQIRSYISLKKPKMQYRNKDKTLTEKFVTKFNDKFQKEIDFQKMKEHELQLLKNKEQRKNNFLLGLKGLSEDIDNLGFFSNRYQEDAITSSIDEVGIGIKLKNTFSNTRSEMNLFRTQFENKSSGLFLTHGNPNAGNINNNYNINNNEKPIDVIPISSNITTIQLSQLNPFKRNSQTYHNTVQSSFQKAKKRFSSSSYNEDISMYKSVDLKLPKKYEKKILPIKMTSMAKTLNDHLSKLDQKYAKDEIAKRYRDNPKTSYFFDKSQYYAYRVSKINDNKDLIKPKLQPLKVRRERGIEKLASSIFNNRTVLLDNLKTVFYNREQV